MSREPGILVVANETVESALLFEGIRLGRAAIGPAGVAIVAPALNTRAGHWTCDDREARHAAELRLAQAINTLAADGIDAEGWIGDDDPIVAVADALRQVPVDLVVVATTGGSSCNWRTHDLPERLRRQFELPVLVLTVDRRHGREILLDGAGRAHGQARLARAA